MKKINFFGFVILSVFVFQLAGCTSAQQTGLQGTFAELERNRHLWRENKIENYDFELERLEEGEGGSWTLTIKIRDKKTLPFTKNNGHDFAPPFYEEHNSVEKLFDYIQQWSDEEHIMNIEYDEKYGFPKSISSRSKNSNGWVSLKIKCFEIVK